MTLIRLPLPLLALWAASSLSACASIEAARIETPPALRSIAPEELRGLGAGRQGTLVLPGVQGRFERGADRLALFSDALVFDKVRASYTLRHDDGREVAVSCRGRQTEGSAGIVSGALRPWTVHCGVQGSEGLGLTLTGTRAGAGTRDERRGRWAATAASLEIESLHRWEGAAFASPGPVGYVLRHEGRAIGAIELNGTRPRVWRPAPGAALRDDVTHALLALALLWDPAS